MSASNCKWCGDSHPVERLCGAGQRGMTRRSFLFLTGMAAVAAALPVTTPFDTIPVRLIEAVDFPFSPIDPYVTGVQMIREVIDDTRFGDTYQRFMPGEMHIEIKFAEGEPSEEEKRHGPYPRLSELQRRYPVLSGIRYDGRESLIVRKPPTT